MRLTIFLFVVILSGQCECLSGCEDWRFGSFVGWVWIALFLFLFSFFYKNAFEFS